MSTISIKLDGVDITDDVIISTAMFSMGTNAAPGQCQFEIRDGAHAYAPIAGKEITLDVDGERCWLGHAIKLARGYTLPVVDTTGDPGAVTRKFLITGNDINFQAFNKRIAYRPSSPSKPTLPPPAGFRCSTADGEWAEGTRVDDTALYLLRNYTDLVADGITFDISNFGSPNPDACATYSGAMTVGQMMTDLNRLLMGVFYVRPDRTLRYHDADTVTSSKVLTDRPTPGDPDDVGARDYKALRDGTTLINDALVWGAALGFDQIRFARATDNDDTGGVSSITDHGRWQVGDFNPQIYKQATVQERADSIVYGLTASQKGARWPRVVVEATVFAPLFQIGDVVTCEFHGYNKGTLRREPFDAPDGNAVSTGLVKIDLPVRKIMITFPTPTEAKFQLMLSREIDTPYNAYEFRFQRFDYPPPGGYIPRWPRPPVGVPEPSTCDCGFTDEFNRTVSSGSLGTADCGLPWNVGNISTNAALSVNGDEADINTIGPGTLGVSSASAYLGGSGLVGERRSYINSLHTLTFRLQNRTFTASDVEYELRWMAIHNVTANIKMATGNTRLRFSAGANDGTLVPDGFFTDSGVYTWTQYYDEINSNIVSAVSDGSTTYSVTLATGYPTEARIAITAILNQQLPFTGSDKHWLIDWIDMPEFTRCMNAQFDDFNRSVGSGWGTASPSGSLWTLGSGGSGLSSSVTGTQGSLSLGTAGTFANFRGIAPSDVVANDPLSMVMRFVTPTAPSGSVVLQITCGTTDDQGLYGVDSGGSVYYVIGAVIDWSASGTTLLVTTDVNDGSSPATTTSASITNLSASTAYLLRWERSGTTTRARVWQANAAEPSSWDVTGTITGDLADSPSNVMLMYARRGGTTSPAKTLLVDSIDFEYDDRPCYIDDGEPVPPPPPLASTGEACEYATMVDTTHWQLRNAFVAGSSRVWIDGHQLRRGTAYDYVEHPQTGVIELLDPLDPAPGAFYVCYIAMGRA